MSNISGMWLGTYWQRGIPTRFEVTLIQGKNILSGRILDQSNLGDATIIGKVIGKSISFRKTYLTGSCHSIDYIGTIGDDLNSMNGTWQEDYFNRGNWEAHRQDDNLVVYIIDISFSKTNTLLHITDFSGNLKFFCSAGLFKYKGKRKRSRFQVVKYFYNILLSKFKFLRFKPVALHLKNVGNARFWIIKKFKKKSYIRIIRNFNLYPYNGCHYCCVSTICRTG